MYDVKKFLAVGGYDENMFLYCEEVTIGIKLKAKGYTTLLLGKEKYYHEHSVTINKSISSKIKQAEMVYNNRLYVMRKYLKASFVTLLIAKLLQKRRIKQMRKKDNQG